MATSNSPSSKKLLTLMIGLVGSGSPTFCGAFVIGVAEALCSMQK